MRFSAPYHPTVSLTSVICPGGATPQLYPEGDNRGISWIFPYFPDSLDFWIVFPCGEWPSTLDYFCRALQVHVSDCSCFCGLLQIRMPQPPTPHPRALWGGPQGPPGLPQGPFGPLGTDGASRRADGGGRTALRAAHKVFFVLSWETFSMSEVRMRNAELPNLAQIRSEYFNLA